MAEKYKKHLHLILVKSNFEGNLIIYLFYGFYDNVKLNN